MESTLRGLVASLRATSAQLSALENPTLQDALHNPDSLPDQDMHQLAAETLDLLEEVRLLLEPRPMILADHFMGGLPLTLGRLGNYG
jgi:hypothetical protein